MGLLKKTGRVGDKTGLRNQASWCPVGVCSLRHGLAVLFNLPTAFLVFYTTSCTLDKDQVFFLNLFIPSRIFYTIIIINRSSVKIREQKLNQFKLWSSSSVV